MAEPITEKDLREVIAGKPIPDKHINGGVADASEQPLGEAFLIGQLEVLKTDQQNALGVVNQCAGAIALCEAMLARLRTK